MHPVAFKILQKFRGQLYLFAEVGDPLPSPPRPSPAFPLFLFYEMTIEV